LKVLDTKGFGWRITELLVRTGGGTAEVSGKALLERKEVTFVARTIGPFTIDLRVGAFVRNGGEVLSLVEEVKAMHGLGV